MPVDMQLLQRCFPYDKPRPGQLEVCAQILSAYIDEGIKDVVLDAPTGCHAAGTGILMYDGSVKLVENVLVGDLIMGPDSMPREVLSLIQGRQQLVEICPVKGESFVVNLDHILSLQATGTAPTTTVNITVREWEARCKWFKHMHKLYRVSVLFPFPTKDLPIPPYILGVWLGDGATGRPKITTPDKEVAEEWVEYGRSLGLQATVYTKITPDGNINKASDYSITSGMVGYSSRTPNPFMEKLKECGITEKHIPHRYLVSTREARLQLLAGLVDSDGHLSGQLDFIQKRKHISESVVFLARSLGFAAYLAECRKSDQHGTWGTYWRVSISGDLSVIPTRVPRKTSMARKQIKHVTRTGFRIKLLEEGDFFGFSLSGDHLYLTSDFIVHHNSGKSAINVCVSKYLEIVFDYTGFSTTPLKTLQDQYAKDPSFKDAFRVIKGRTAYPCNAWEEGEDVDRTITYKDDGTYEEEDTCGKHYCMTIDYADERAKRRAMCADAGICDFAHAVEAAQAHPLALNNLHTLIYQQAPFAPYFEPRNFLIMDECHMVEDALLGLFSFTISEKIFRDYGLESKYGLFYTPPSQYQNIYEIGVEDIDHLQELRDALESIIELNGKTMKEEDVLKVSSLARNISKFLQNPRDWVCDISKVTKQGKKVGYEYKPLYPEDYAFWVKNKGVNFRLYMSATVLDPEAFCKIMNIDPSQSRYLQMPCLFPKENRPIFAMTKYPIKSLAKNDLEANLPALADAVDDILTNYKDHRGLIHCYSYKIGEYLQTHCKQGHRMMLHDADNRGEVLNMFTNAKGNEVLVSPSMYEGVDLKDDLARFQILCKVPYLQMGDAQIKARMAMDPKWALWRVVLKVVQAAGRIIRHDKDKGHMFILDPGFPGWFYRAQKILPEYFKESVYWNCKTLPRVSSKT